MNWKKMVKKEIERYISEVKTKNNLAYAQGYIQAMHEADVITFDEWSDYYDKLTKKKVSK